MKNISKNHLLIVLAAVLLFLFVIGSLSSAGWWWTIGILLAVKLFDHPKVLLYASLITSGLLVVVAAINWEYLQYWGYVTFYIYLCLLISLVLNAKK